MKVVKIIKDDCITGVEYGEVEVPYTEITPNQPDPAIDAAAAATAFKQAKQMCAVRTHKRNTKHK